MNSEEKYPYFIGLQCSSPVDLTYNQLIERITKANSVGKGVHEYYKKTDYKKIRCDIDISQKDFDTVECKWFKNLNEKEFEDYSYQIGNELTNHLTEYMKSRIELDNYDIICQTDHLWNSNHKDSHKLSYHYTFKNISMLIKEQKIFFERYNKNVMKAILKIDENIYNSQGKWRSLGKKDTIKYSNGKLENLKWKNRDGLIINNELSTAKDIKTIDVITHYINDTKKISLKDLIKNEDISVLNNHTVQSQQTTKDMKNIYNMSEAESVVSLSTNIEKVRELLDLLKIERFSNFNEWFIIGAAIYKSTNNINLWIEYSKKVPKYKNEKMSTYTEKWDYFEKYAYTMGTLIHMAKEDDYDGYIKWSNTYNSLYQTTSYLFTNVDNRYIKEPNDYGCAEVLYSHFGQNFLYDSMYNNWYIFNQNNGFWEIDSKGNNLFNFINIDLKRLLIDYYSKRQKYYLDRNEDDKAKNYAEALLKTHKYINKNKNKQAIINELTAFYVNHKKIFEKFDEQDMYLFPFKNGVFDLKNMDFRKATQNEYITKYVQYEYCEKYDPEAYEYLNTMITNIQPNEDTRNYLLKVLSLGLIGENIHEKFFLWRGDGSNGKGGLQKICELTFDIFFGILENTHFTKTKGQINANSANPELAALSQSRIVFVNEIEQGQEIKEGFLKQITGNDTINCRFLHKNTFSYTPKFKLHIQSNHEVELETTERSIQRRCVFIPFTQTFVKNPCYENERPIDENLKTKIKDDKYKIAFFHILLEAYKKYQISGLNEPEEVKKATNSYFDRMDYYYEIIKIRYNRCECKNIYNCQHKIYINDFREEFQLMYEDKKFSRNKLESMIKRRYNGKIYRDVERFIKGFILIEDNEK